MRCDPGGGCVQSHGLMSGGTSVNPTTGSTSAFPTEGPETVFAFIHPNALEHRLDRGSLLVASRDALPEPRAQPRGISFPALPTLLCMSNSCCPPTRGGLPSYTCVRW